MTMAADADADANTPPPRPVVICGPSGVGEFPLFISIILNYNDIFSSSGIDAIVIVSLYLLMHRRTRHSLFTISLFCLSRQQQIQGKEHSSNYSKKNSLPINLDFVSLTLHDNHVRGK
jgi:hypothetical protein